MWRGQSGKGHASPQAGTGAAQPPQSVALGPGGRARIQVPTRPGLLALWAPIHPFIPCDLVSSPLGLLTCKMRTKMPAPLRVSQSFPGVGISPRVSFLSPPVSHLCSNSKLREGLGDGRRLRCAPQLAGTVPPAASFSGSKERPEASEGSRSCQPGIGAWRPGIRADAGEQGATGRPLRFGGLGDGWPAPGG